MKLSQSTNPGTAIGYPLSPGDTPPLRLMPSQLILHKKLRQGRVAFCVEYSAYFERYFKTGHGTLSSISTVVCVFFPPAPLIILKQVRYFSPLTESPIPLYATICQMCTMSPDFQICTIFGQTVRLVQVLSANLYLQIHGKGKRRESNSEDPFIRPKTTSSTKGAKN